MLGWRGLAAGLLVLGQLGVAQAQNLPFTVAVPQKGNWDTGLTDWGIKAGMFKAEGLDVTTVYTQGGSQTIQAVISGSVDIAVGTGILGIVGAFSKGAPVRVTAAEMTGASDLFWIVKADSPLKTLKDAAGKTISFSEAGSSSNLVLLGLLKQADVAAKPVSVGGVPNSLTQLMSGQIDIAWSAVPFNLADVKAGKLRILAKGSDVADFKNQTIRANFTTTSTLAAKAEAFARYNRAYVKVCEWAYNDPAAVGYFAEAAKIPLDVAKDTLKEYLPQSAIQPFKIEGLDLILKEAADFKYTPKLLTAADVAPLFSDMIKPPK